MTPPAGGLTGVQAGDVFVHRDDKGFVPSVIHLCEARKYGKGKSPADPAWWNHTGMACDDATLIEADASGVERNPISKYTSNIRWFRPPYASPTAQLAAVEEMESMVGSKYADLVIVSDALYLVFKTTLRFGFAHKHTCSGAVSQALELGGVNLGDGAEWNSPADVFAAARGWPEVAL